MNSPRANLPLLATAMASKEVTHNEALYKLEALSVGALVSAITTTPPSSPAEGDLYIIPGGATGIWSTRIAQVAHYFNSSWHYYVPNVGWHFLSIDDKKTRMWNSTAWLVIYNPI